MLSRRHLIAAVLLVGAARRVRTQSEAPILPFIGVDHVSLRVSDVRRSTQFYMTLFGSDASRDVNRQANPGSVAGELSFIRLGDSHLSLSPLSPDEEPGVDHFCFSVTAFDKTSARLKLSAFDQPWPEWPSNNLWLKDPDGHLVQLAPSANAPRLPGIVRGATPLERPARVTTPSPFRGLLISRLTLVTANLPTSSNYYRRLLGRSQGGTGRASFRVGASDFVLAQAPDTECIRVAVSSFDARTAERVLSSLGVVSDVASDGDSISFHDPDQIRIEIAAD
jgi:catechol 2,3-dioxygenase-like lactoylglutathione lyase family enzyme